MTAISQAIKFNGGGHHNHEFFWESLAPVGKGQGGDLPSTDSDLYKKVVSTWGSFDNFINLYSTQTAAIQGSGWGWLVYNKATKGLEYITTANQDRASERGPNYVPLLTIDIWEHAYYLDYFNVRPNFLKEIWKVVNWSKVSQRLTDAMAY